MTARKNTRQHASPFAPGTVVKNRGRLWRVDGQEDDVLIATAIDTGEPEQLKFYIPFEDIRPGRLEPASPDIAGHAAAQDLLLRAYRLSLLHGPEMLAELLAPFLPDMEIGPQEAEVE